MKAADRPLALRLAALAVLLVLHSQYVCAAETGVDPDGFSATFRIDFDRPAGEEVLYEAPGSWKLLLRDAGADPSLADSDRKLENYLNYALPDRACPIVEAVVVGAKRSPLPHFKKEFRGCRVGVPFGALQNPGGVHEVRVTCAKTHWQIRVDGTVINDDCLVSPMALPDEATARACSPRIKAARLTRPAPADALGVEPASRPVAEPIQYWTAGGFNTWVGDVAVCAWRGRFHVFYLKDRRHHRSKGGSGGHCFAHISSTDLVHWDEHPIVTPIEDYWFTCGTGTPFVFKDRLHLAYGIHSTRFVLREQTTEPKMLAGLAQTGVMPAVRFDETDLVPLGCTWAESEDGIHFKRSNIVCHTTQNPAVEVLPDGTLRLTTGFGGDTGAKGVWESDQMTGWRQTQARAALSGDCPCPFEWHGWNYLLQGFGGFAVKKPGAARHELKRGTDIYDGLNVPMVAPWQGDRRLIVGWIRHFHGWGGWLCFRELIQREDGSLGTKWVKEIAPPSPVRAYQGKAGQPLLLRFEGEGRPVELGVFPADGKAHFVDVLPDGSREKYTDTAVCQSLCVTGVRGLDRDYQVRVVVHYDRKANATLFDAEIAGNRTIVCRRPGRYAAAK